MVRSASTGKTKKKAVKKVPPKGKAAKPSTKPAAKAVKSKPQSQPASNGGRPKSPNFKGAGLRDVAAAVYSKLLAAGHDPILVGTACAAIYCGSVMRTRSLEFAIRDFTIGEVNALMESLGFKPKETRLFAHSSCPFEVQLSPQPITVGDDAVTDAKMIKTAGGPVRMLTPTDCVRQRLSMFYRWGDRSALSEAVEVTKKQAIDMDLVRRWSEWEWASDRFEEFMAALKEAR